MTSAAKNSNSAKAANNKAKPPQANEEKPTAPAKNSAAVKPSNPAKTQQQEVAKTAAKPVSSALGSLALLVAFIALSGVGLVGWQGYQQLQLVNQQLASSVNNESLALAVNNLATQSQLANQQQQLNSQLTSLETQLADELNQHTNQLAGFSQELKALNLPQLGLRQLAEVEFLLHRAEVYSQQLKEPQAAIQLVELALASLNKISLNHKNKLIRQLENDLTQLSQHTQPSRLEIAKQLHLLAAETHQLASFAPKAASNQIQTEATENLVASPWYQQAWQEIKSLIVIQPLNEEFQLLPFSPEEEAVKQQLNALLLQAATAASLGQSELYLSCLEGAEQRLALFGTQAALAGQLLTKIAQLKEQNLNPQLPSLAASLNELTQLQASLNQPSQE